MVAPVPPSESVPWRLARQCPKFAWQAWIFDASMPACDRQLASLAAWLSCCCAWFVAFETCYATAGALGLVWVLAPVSCLDAWLSAC